MLPEKPGKENYNQYITLEEKKQEKRNKPPRWKKHSKKWGGSEWVLFLSELKDYEAASAQAAVCLPCLSWDMAK